MSETFGVVQSPEGYQFPTVGGKNGIGYEPAYFCRGCGRDFVSLDLFDGHHAGSPADERTCRTDAELAERGMEVLPDEERPEKRQGLGVELWFSPEARDKAREAFAK